MLHTPRFSLGRSVALSCLIWVLAAPAVCALDREVIISTYQGPCVDGDFPANLAVVRKAIDEALTRGSDFLVFPEAFLSGYNSRENVRLGARRLNDPGLQAFIAESRNHSMVILVGLARLDGEDLFNSVLVIHRGELLGFYDKIMLTRGDREDIGFRPGFDVPVFSANGVRFGVVICHDSSFPYPALLARLKGAEVLFSPHYNSIPPATVDAHRKWVRNCHIGLACQMKMVVVRSNVVVTGSPNRVGYGDSFVISPQGEMLAQAELFRTEMITARISPEHFRFPAVWADLEETPAALKAILGRILMGQSAP